MTIDAASSSDRRAAIYLFYDEAGVVDDYVIRAITAFREHARHLLVVCNCVPDESGLARLREAASDVFVRENVGFDVWAYRDGLERIGRNTLATLDEVILLNYTFFAPIFPLSEMFDEMAGRDCDFWGITAHKECRPNPLTGGDVLPYHIQSHFIAIRAPMLHGDAFWEYWTGMPEIGSYLDSIALHETRFTEHFHALGYRSDLYMGMEDFHSDHPAFLEIDRMMERRCPILKRRPFFHDPLYHEAEAIDLRRALDVIAENSSYDLGLIWQNLLRTTNLRTLYTNVEQLEILPETASRSVRQPRSLTRIGVLAHVYYVEMLEEMLEYACNIPGRFDLIVTTDSEFKRAAIARALAGFTRGDLRIIVTESNVGRDSSALLIGNRDVVLSSKYDLLCRIHSKRSPQDGSNRGLHFKRHLFDNLLGSTGYVSNLLDQFERDPTLGLVMPPVIHIGYPTLGHAWFLNRPLVEEISSELGIDVPFDTHTPIATYGSMFWFRPAALTRMFEHPWRWQDFESDTYADGDLPHAVERVFAYCAQASGYSVRCVFTSRHAAKNYAKLEYKHQLLASCFRSGDVRLQILQMMQGDTPAAVEPDAPLDASAPNVRLACVQLASALKRSVAYRCAKLVRSVRGTRETQLEGAKPARNPS